MIRTTSLMPPACICEKVLELIVNHHIPQVHIFALLEKDDPNQVRLLFLPLAIIYRVSHSGCSGYLNDATCSLSTRFSSCITKQVRLNPHSLEEYHLIRKFFTVRSGNLCWSKCRDSNWCLCRQMHGFRGGLVSLSRTLVLSRPHS